MQGNKIKGYRYTRGDAYACDVMIIDGEHVIFDNLKYPSTASIDLIDKLMDDAERHALAEYTKV